MIWLKDILALIFDYYRKTESLCTLRRLDQYYSQLYRNELICSKLNRIINIESLYSPSLNFSTCMKREFKKKRTNKLLYFCIVTYNMENFINPNRFIFKSVKCIESIKESILLSRESIYPIDSTRMFVEWHHDGKFILKSYEIKGNSFKIRTVIPRIREISYGIRCIAVILIEGKYTIAHCLVDPLTTTILGVYELETGSYLNFWYECTLL